MQLGEAFNKHLDKLVRPEVRLFHRSWSTFQVCGYIGLAIAILLAMSLVIYRGLSPWVVVGLIPAVLCSFFGVAMLTKIIVGKERLTYYHHEIAVVAVAALLFWLLRQPLLPYLDATILGLGTFLVCGRVGCLMVGCCHGRPYQWGVCYREEHAATVFTPYYVGVRLFPIQAVESLWVCCIVFVGCWLILGGSSPGGALAWYVIAYDTGRFCFEFGRGDPDRAYLWGLSEAQWTSLILMIVVIGVELSGILPLQRWHIGLTIGMLLVVIAVILRWQFSHTTRYQLLHPHHIREIAAVIELLSNLGAQRNNDPPVIHMGTTYLGIQMSASTIQSATGWLYHYALSCQKGDMSKETATILAALIHQLTYQAGSTELICGNDSIFHLLIHLSSAQFATPTIFKE